MKWTSEEFYPTPEALLDKITGMVQWDRISSILEPSAGKGNIVEYCKKKCSNFRYNKDLDIDCIEMDEDLQKTLKGKGLRLIHDDFLSFHTFKHYDLIIMNPPFSQGAKHLLHALALQDDNYGLICILNAETLRNPYTNERKELLKKLTDLNAEIEYMAGEFATAERPTGVEIAVVKVIVPEKERESAIFEGLKKRSYQETPDMKTREIAPSNYLEAAVRQYNLEVEAGIKLILEYKAMSPHILCDLRDTMYNQPILDLKIDSNPLSTNAYVRMVRAKYWKALFENPQFTGKMTSNLQRKYHERISELKEYDFSLYNIRTIQEEISKNLIQGIEECIISLFDDLSHQYAYSDELKNNIHYYNGWKTNKSWYINKKVVIPYMRAFSEWSGAFEPNYDVLQRLADIEKALNYLDGGLTESLDLYDAMQTAKRMGQTRKIRLKYFYVTFYKKGTCHLEFINEELLKKFNIFGSQQKGWLPQDSGRKKYSEMAPEEQSVIDSFEGACQYSHTLEKADYYIYNPEKSLKLIETTEERVA